MGLRGPRVRHFSSAGQYPCRHAGADKLDFAKCSGHNEIGDLRPWPSPIQQGGMERSGEETSLIQNALPLHRTTG